MPAKSYYDLAVDENFDIKIPAYPEEAFQQGIRFCAKYIGTQDISRPSSRVEIVAAMRHIRYEYKAKGVKKRNAVLSISVSGIEVYYQKRRRKTPVLDSNCVLLMKHPTYRVFYVSHDSQDLKIFSFIARDSGSNVFRCSVFKAYKKSDAILMVRTIGQAFEVCHKMNQQGKDSDRDSQRDDQSEKSAPQSESRVSGSVRLPNSDSIHSGTSSALSSRSIENGSSMHKSDSAHSGPQPTGVSSSSTATSGFMQNSIYSSESLPNAFAALLSQNQSSGVGGRASAAEPVNVETAIKTAQELLRYATSVYRRPNYANTPGSISATTSYHESVSMPRSPSGLPADSIVSEIPNSVGSVSSNVMPATGVNGSQLMVERMQNVDRYVSDNIAPSTTNTVPGASNVVTAIAEAKQRLLQEQLIHETALRIEAQARVQQLLVINKQLTQHIYRLSDRVQRLQVDLTKLQCSSTETQALAPAPDHLQPSQTNCLTQPTGYAPQNVAIVGSDIPRLEPPPSLHRHQIRLGTSKSTSRDSFSVGVVDRNGSGIGNGSGNNGRPDVSQQQVNYNNLDLLASSCAPLSSQTNANASHRTVSVNGLKADHLLMFSSSSGSDDENNKTKLIRPETTIGDRD